MSVSSVDNAYGVHHKRADSHAYANTNAEIIGNAIDQPTHSKPQPEHSSAADDDIGEAISKIRHGVTMPDFRGTWKMQVSELDMASLSGLLRYLSIRGKVGDASERAMTVECVRSIIEGLDRSAIDVADAVALQALAIAICKDIPACADQPELVVSLSGYAVILMETAGYALELLTGERLDDYRDFEDMTPSTQH